MLFSFTARIQNNFLTKTLDSYTLAGPYTEKSSSHAESSKTAEANTPNAPGDALVNIDLSDTSIPPNNANANNNKKKRRKLCCSKQTAKVWSIMLVVCGAIAGIGYFTWDEFHKGKPPEHEPGHNATTPDNGINGTNGSKMFMTRHDIPKVILPLWDDDDEVTEEDIPGGLLPGEKPECSMRSKKPQCYTGHLCYRRKCVPWCKTKWDTCYTGHTCMLNDTSNWRLCSIEPEYSLPCTENYITCEENRDCCTGSCQRRGEINVCVPPMKFERRPKGWKGNYWPEDEIEE